MTHPAHAALAELQRIVAELVELKDLKDWLDANQQTNTLDGDQSEEWVRKHADYLYRKPLAWAAARKALESPVEQPEGPVEKLAELMRGLGIDAHLGAASARQLFVIGRAIADQAKREAPWDHPPALKD